jgi:hypothetical protein
MSESPDDEPSPHRDDAVPDDRPPRDTEQYAVVRHAVEDALWSVLGTTVYGVFLALLLVVGLGMLMTGLTIDPQRPGFTLLLVGIVLTGGAGVELARTFGLFPAVRGRGSAPDRE